VSDSTDMDVITEYEKFNMLA